MTRKPLLLVLLTLLVGGLAGYLLATGRVLAQEETPDAPAAPVADVGSAFTYQGQLMDNGVLANGPYDFSFILYDASVGGAQVGAPVTLEDVSVTDGLFTVSLDYGSVFDGTALWLAIGVRPGAETGAYTPLNSRQPLTATPFALDLVPYSASIDLYGAKNTTGGRGVYGYGGAASGTSDGVWGRSDSPEGRGVLGWATHTSGASVGVWGQTDSTSSEASGIYGWASSVSGNGTGVQGISEGQSGRGVYGLNNGDFGYGVYGQGLTGVYGQTPATITGAGVAGYSSFGYGVYGSSDVGHAGYFAGDVEVTGNLINSLAVTRIDHPLDPANRYLDHFAQAAPEVQNVYNGIAVLDDSGAAVIALPTYFAAVNTGGYRYQLTAVGAAMPDLHIAQEIEDGRFAIAGGAPRMKVSWEVTAVRDDPYLRDNPVATEQGKPSGEAGTYLYPAGYGQPEELGLNYQRRQEMLQK